MDLRRIILARYAGVLALVLIFSVAIMGRIIYVQFTTGEKWEGKLQSLENQTEVIQGNRGNIYSTKGRLLASSVPFYEIRFDLAAPGVREVFKSEVDALAGELAKVFADKTKSQFKRDLNAAYRQKARYYLVDRRKINYDELQRVKTFPIFNRGKFKGGFMPEQEFKRYTPHGNLAFRTIGIMNKGAYGGDHGSIGISGIEEQFEGYLRGEDGLLVRQNLSGRWVNVSTIEPENGMDVITTIDIYLQDVVEHALEKQLIRSRAEYGTAILMEVKTGKVRAIANLGLQNGRYNEIYNYAIGHEGCSEPGSTFKLMSMMVALDDGKIDTSDVFDVGDGKWKIYDRTIYDSDYGHANYGGKMTVKEIFEHSSNVGTAKIIDQFYSKNPKAFIDRLYSVGLNKPLDLGIKGEATPYIKYPTDKSWWGTSLAYIAHGYEIQLTPLQVLTFYNAVANDGRMMKPMFVEAIGENGKRREEFRPEVLKSSICSDETVGKLQVLLKSVVESGTAKSLKTSKYTFAGKTGTAKVSDMDKGYTHHKYRASFCGYFPADNPKYSCMVMVAEPKGAYYGGSVAGPVFREIADCVYSTDLSLEIAQKEKEKEGQQIPSVLNGMVKETKLVCEELDIKVNRSDVKGADWVYTIEGETSVDLKPRNIVVKQMPNVMGMGISDAIYLIEKSGLKTKVNGVGKVRKQSPEPGTNCQKGQLVYLDLS
ncbi:MAG: penicillin-binding protein [Prolixibacteraceae bacterium]